MEDKNIIDLYNARDERAIAETSDKYGKYCYTIAYNILFDELDSEECVSDTWLTTWNSIPPQMPSCLRLFLSKIVRNISFDRYRAKNAQKRGGGETTAALEEIDEVSLSIKTPEDEMSWRELESAFERFLRQLPERECNIFLRRYYFVDPVCEIARRYKMRESNVHMILSRIRKKLRNYLEREGYTV